MSNKLNLVEGLTLEDREWLRIRRVIRHKPSLSAADKQSILPDLLVQKTVTILIESKFVLCSSVGDLKISRKLLGEIAVTLGLPRRGNKSYINPAAFIPEIELGLLRGMVSTSHQVASRNLASLRLLHIRQLRCPM
jgi:hypothetical protein